VQLYLGAMETTTHHKPVPLEMELDFHERLLNTVGKSISMTKKRLHDAELALNLRPPDDETEEIKLWKAKVAGLIEKRAPLEFPTLYKVKKEYDSNALVKSIMTGRQRIESHEIYNQRMNRMLTKEAALIRKKVLSKSSTFGKKSDSSMRTIQGYKGANTMYQEDRTLVRKEGTYCPEEEGTSVPSWIGPQYYPNAGSEPKRWEHAGQYQLAFKSMPRSAVSKEEAKNRQAARPAHSAQFNFEHMGDTMSASHSSLDGLTAFSLASLEYEEGSEELALQVDGDDGSGTAASTRSGRSRSNSPGRKNVGFQEALLDRGEASTPRTPSSSIHSERRTKSILRHPRPTTTETAARVVQPQIQNPIFTRKDFTMKMLRMEEAAQTRFFKVKDYTMDAFAGTPSHVNYIDDFEADDKDIQLDSSYGVYQHRTHSTYRKPPTIGTFTSDIFYVKPPEYVPAHKEKVEQQAREAEGFTGVSAVYAVSGVTGAGTAVDAGWGQFGDAVDANNLTYESAASITSSGHKKKEIPGYAKALAGKGHEHKEYHLRPLTADLELARNKQERTVDKILLRRNDSRKTGKFENLTEDDLSLVSNDSFKRSTGRMPRSAAVENHHNLERWLRENHVIRANRDKRVGGAEFLAAHKPLPSIALSLTGLILPHNPYTPDDPFVKSTFGKVEKDHAKLEKNL
jgi:hypothetical protein